MTTDRTLTETMKVQAPDAKGRVFVVAGPCRFSWLNVFKPRRNNMNEKMEHSVTLLFPKDPTEQSPNAPSVIKELQEAIKSALAHKFGEKIPPGARVPLKDGDKETNTDGEPRHPGYWYMNATSGEEFKPKLIDGQKREVTDERAWVSGDWGYAKISIFAYDKTGNKGASAGLYALQFVWKGEPLGGGGGNSVDDFDEFEAATPAGDNGEYDPFAES